MNPCSHCQSTKVWGFPALFCNVGCPLCHCRSLAPDPATLAAIARASQGGANSSSSSTQTAAAAAGAGRTAGWPPDDGSVYPVGSTVLTSLPCCCALCTAAQAACGRPAAAAAAVGAAGHAGLPYGLCNGSSSSSGMSCFEGLWGPGVVLDGMPAGAGMHGVLQDAAGTFQQQQQQQYPVGLLPHGAAALPSSGRVTPDAAASALPATAAAAAAARSDAALAPAPAQLPSAEVAIKLLSNQHSSNIISGGHHSRGFSTAAGAGLTGGHGVPGSKTAAAAAAAAAAGGLRSGGSFSDLRQLLSTMRGGAASPITRPPGHAALSSTAAAGAAGAAAASTAAGGGVSVSSSAHWWLQRRCQVLVLLLLLLSAANIAVSDCTSQLEGAVKQREEWRGVKGPWHMASSNVNCSAVPVADRQQLPFYSLLPLP